MMNRHWCEMDLVGLKVIIPATDMDVIHGLWSKEGERLELGAPYYKLKVHQRCLCVTPGQRQDVLDQMAGLMQEAAAIASAENEQFNQNIANAGHPNLRVGPRATKAPEGES